MEIIIFHKNFDFEMIFKAKFSEPFKMEKGYVS